MNIDFNNINIQTFCDLQGVTDIDRFVLNKRYKNVFKSYQSWFNVIITEFAIGEKKFSNVKEK